MKCLSCKKDLFKRGATMTDGSICAGEHIEIKWTSIGEEYIECKRCKAKNFIEDAGPHTFTIGHFTND